MAATKTPKRFSVTLDPESAGKGMKLVSLVKSPAIGIGWVALSTEAQPQVKRIALSKESKKQIITGPLLVPGLDIARLDDKGEVFYINFSAEEIEKIGQRFMLEAKGLALSNQNHADALEGNHICELWLTADAAIDKAALHGFDVPAGTLMASMKVADSEFWKNEVETGNVTGFSIEGLFDFSELKLQAASVAAKKPMTFLSKLRAALALAFADTVNLAAVTLDDDTALEVDDATGEVYSLNDDGTRGEAFPDGSYKLKDGAEFVVTNGKHVGHTVNEGDTAKAQLAAPVVTPDAAKPAAAAPVAAGAADSEPETEKRLKALEDGLAKILKIVEKDATDDAAAGEKPGSAALARAETDPVKLAAIELALEAVDMADGSQFSYNPITRRLLDSTGKMVESGQYACADGSYFKVNTEQYTYQIDKESYDKGVQLSAVELELSDLKSKKPGGSRLKLGAAAPGGEEVNLAEMSPAKRRLHLARQSAKND